MTNPDGSVTLTAREVARLHLLLGFSLAAIPTDKPFIFSRDEFESTLVAIGIINPLQYYIWPDSGTGITIE